jgi:beta-lactamase class A
MVTYSPVCQTRMNATMTIAELCKAALTVSDNTAANLLLRALGGPCAVTTFANHLCKGGFKLDHTEPRLNEVRPEELHDSTTPVAMLRCLQALLVQGALSLPMRNQLQDWMNACQTGNDRLRAGLPRGWSVGDKTGSWNNSRTAHTNDVAIAWPPAGAENPEPLLIAAYLKFCPATAEARNAALAETARAVAEHFRI